MEHLNAETLARLVDEAPSDAERRHLHACRACAGELGAYRELTESLGRLPDLVPPPGDWEVLQARLMSEGLLEGGGRLRTGLAHTPPWMKVAAAVLLFLSGTGLGIGFAGGNGTGPFRSGGGEGPFRTVASSTRPADLEEAAEVVRLAERRYIDAMVQYRQMSETQSGSFMAEPEARIAALEYMVRAAQTALREAPADPFLNGLVATAVAERDAVLRRVSSGGEGSWY